MELTDVYSQLDCCEQAKNIIIQTKVAVLNEKREHFHFLATGRSSVAVASSPTMTHRIEQITRKIYVNKTKYITILKIIRNYRNNFINVIIKKTNEYKNIRDNAQTRIMIMRRRRC